MAELTSMKYRVITARNPKTGGSLLRPVVTDRNTMSMKQLVAYAKTAGFVRGQQKDLEGLLGGFIEAMQDRGKSGYSINVNDWFIISGQLKGTVGDDRQLTAANDYHVTISASKDLKVGIDNFSWTRVDDTGIVIKVESLSSPNGNKGEIIRAKAIVATGKNLAFDATWGDKIIATWMEGGIEKTAELTPSEKSETYLRFDWPTAFANIPTNTNIAFTFRLHGSEGAAEQVSMKTAKLLAGDGPAILGVKQDDLADSHLKLLGGKVTITGRDILRPNPGDTVKFELYNGTTLDAVMDTTSTIEDNTETKLVLTSINNDSGKDDSYWANKDATLAMTIDGARITYPVHFDPSV